MDSLWLETLQEVMGKAAHEVKDALNGVTLNVEVLRSRTSEGKGQAGALGQFANAAAEQLEVLSARVEAILFLARPHRAPGEPADLAVTLKHLALLLVPATRADGGSLVVEGYGVSVPTAAPARAVRLALAAGLLGLIKEGGSGRCRLESKPEPVVRFSHESAVAGALDPAVASAIANHKIRSETSGSELVLVFPGS